MPRYTITQTDLDHYRQLEHRLRLDAAVLACYRASLIDNMAGPDSIEPGPLHPIVTYRDTGQTTLTEEGRRPLLKRHLIVVDLA